LAKPWITLDRIDTEEGTLELRQRGAKDFLITLGGLVLMNSLANRSEVVLGQLGCRHLANHPSPRVLVGGLGMGYTLRAVLDCLPATAGVVVAELNPAVVEWCRGPLALLTDSAVEDPRVTVEICDVAELVHGCAQQSNEGRFEAVVFDLYKGPHYRTDKVNDPLYGSKAINNVRTCLKPEGLFTVWGESYDAGFDRRLQAAGFITRSERPGRGGYRHVVFVAKKTSGKGRQGTSSESA
jgi:spermidine synthase